MKLFQIKFVTDWVNIAISAANWLRNRLVMLHRVQQPVGVIFKGHN